MIARFRYCPLATLLALWRSLGVVTGWRFDFLILSKRTTQHLPCSTDPSPPEREGRQPKTFRARAL